MAIDYEWENDPEICQTDGQTPPPPMPSGGLSIKAAMMRLVGYVARCNNLVNTIQGLDVKDEPARLLATELGAGAAKLVKAVNAERDQIIGPANEFVKSVRNLAVSLTEPLGSAKEIAAQKINTFNQMLKVEQAKRDKEAREKTVADQAFMDAMADKAGVAPVILEPPKVQATKTKARTAAGTSYQHKEWKWAEIEGKFDEVPAEYKLTILDAKKIGEAVKAGVREIPGINIFELSDTRFRS